MVTRIFRVHAGAAKEHQRDVVCLVLVPTVNGMSGVYLLSPKCFFRLKTLPQGDGKCQRVTWKQQTHDSTSP